MKYLFAVTLVALLPLTIAERNVAMKKLTPVIVVEEVEPCVAWWTDRMEFELTMQVPEGDKMGFGAVSDGTVEIMYQSRSSAQADLPELAAGSFDHSGYALFFEVESLDEVQSRLGDTEMVVAERTTFYGSRETWVRTPCGSLVGFAEFPEAEGD